MILDFGDAMGVLVFVGTMSLAMQALREDYKTMAPNPRIRPMKRIVMFGGGSGSRDITMSLCRQRDDITRVVPAWDSGGSSKALRERLGILAMGDIRQALMTLATRLTDKTDGLLVGGITTHSADDQKGHAESYIINAGVASRATDKIAYRMTAGVEIYTGFDDQDTEVGFSYDLGGFWRATEKLTLSLSGRSAYEPAEDVGQNSMLVSTVGLKADYRPLTRWQFTLGGAYRREDYVDNIVVNNAAVQTVADGGEDRTDDQLCGHAQVVFGLNKYASLFANGIYTYTTSSIDDLDYDRWRVTAGVALRY